MRADPANEVLPPRPDILGNIAEAIIWVVILGAASMFVYVLCDVFFA